MAKFDWSESEGNPIWKLPIISDRDDFIAPSYRHSHFDRLPPPHKNNRVISQVFESILRSHGGKLKIKSSHVAGLKGDLVAYDEGEYVIIATVDRADGRWNPIDQKPEILDNDDVIHYANALVEAGVVTFPIVEEIRQNHIQRRMIFQQEMLHILNSVKVIIERQDNERKLAEQRAQEDANLEMEHKRIEMRDAIQRRRSGPRRTNRGGPIPQEDSLGEED
jgi:hypothetical protein